MKLLSRISDLMDVSIDANDISTSVQDGGSCID